MYILPTSSVQHSSTNAKSRGITFGTYNPTAARKFEKELAKKGIFCDSKGNDFIAECYNKTVAVFEKLFGKSYLPDKLSYEPLKNNIYGEYNNYLNQVTLNDKYEYSCYYDMDSLKREAEKHYNSILPSWASTKHPAHTFVHEFSHAAHWNHLQTRNGFGNALRVWTGLVGTTVPTGIGKLITRFKLSNYAVQGDDMCEFLAERMAKDICGGLTSEYWIPYSNIDVDYSHIFSKKWDYRYSSPQSYIDYFTQQVWDGDIDEAKRAGELAEAYLAEIETEKTAPLVRKIAATLDYTPAGSMPDDKPLFYKIGTFLSKALLGANENLTNKLDNKNKLKLHQ